MLSQHWLWDDWQGRDGLATISALIWIYHPVHYTGKGLGTNMAAMIDAGFFCKSDTYVLKNIISVFVDIVTSYFKSFS